MLRKSRILAALFVLAFAPTALAQWNEEVLYSFQGGTDGVHPTGSVVFDNQGNLYGATSNGGGTSQFCLGPAGCGIVYELSPPTQNGAPWAETILHIFRGSAYGDGAAPTGGLVMDSSGNLYGVTGYDGSGQCTLFGSVVGCGTVYEMVPPSQPGGSWTETVIYNFQGGSDGYVPQGDLVFDGAGNLYGATLFGGGKGANCDTLYGGNCGTIFELSPPKVNGGAWTEKVLHSFASAGLWDVFGDGAEPNGGLILDEQGNLYGTTYFGGYALGHCNGGVGGTGCGTVFMLARQEGTGEWPETVLHNFLGDPDGAGPLAGVVADQTGNLFGTTYGGGSDDYGAAYQLIRPSKSNAPWTEKVLYSWSYTQGAIPIAPPLVDPSDGTIYLTAAGGGAFNKGTLSKLQDAGKSWTDTVLYNFNGGGSEAGHPDSKLVFHSGALYSNSPEGGTGSCQGNCGTVYKVWP
ncbi:MAG TPA: choice-of-anchor tandem repeat GloVer-containing protein [Terriglobales bacterium]|nr:choice-of-anchor tandem repeat GloVer-containing protein [Terriglobales bacterium]